jgi:multiple sugar transport system permease protein
MEDLAIATKPAAAGPGRGGTAASATGLAGRLLNFSDRHFFKFAAIPAFIMVFAVTVIPLLSGLGLSFSSLSSSHNAVLPPTLDNYRNLMHDSEVHTVLLNTLLYVVVAVVLETGFGLLLGVLLSQQNRFAVIFRVIFLLPLTVAGIAAAISWSALLNTSQGWVNYLLGAAHLPQPNWLADPSISMLSVILTDMWSGVPVVAILCLAALLGVSREPHEAAMVDGASAWQRFRFVTFPAIRATVILAALLRIIAAFQQFALFQVLTGGGPGLSTTVINYYVYEQTIVYNNLGYGSALAMLVVLIMAVPALIYLLVRRSRRRLHGKASA